jgi:hypothetical protein
MIINEQLAENLFARHGFHLACVNYGTGELLFPRSCLNYPGLFETVQIRLAGRRVQWAWADVGVSCVRGWFSWRGLADRFCVLDVASDRERGQSELATSRGSELWLNQLIQVLPSQMKRAREELAPVVAQRTSEARIASQRYLNAIGFPCSAETASKRLSVKASEAQSVEANLILSHQVGWLANPTFHYAAVLAICCLSPEVEPNVKYNFQDPSEDTPLMWRVQIIADHLMAYPKQMTLVLPRDAGLGYSFREPLVPPADVY